MAFRSSRLLEPKWRLMVKVPLKPPVFGRGCLSLDQRRGLPQPFSIALSSVRPGISAKPRRRHRFCDINEPGGGQFTTLGVGECFLKIGRVAYRQCHILEMWMTTHRPIAKRYTLNCRHVQTSRDPSG